MLSGLEDQIADFEKKKRAQDIAKNDIRDKIRQIKDVAGTREAEIDELKRVILNKERQGNEQERLNDQHRQTQVDMLRDFERQKEVLFEQKDGKDDCEQRNFDANEAIRAKKQKIFELEQKRDKLDQDIRKTIAKLQDKEQEIMLVDG